MKITSYKISPEGIEIFIQTDCEAESQLLAFCEHQSLSLSQDAGWTNRFVVRGVMQQ